MGAEQSLEIGDANARNALPEPTSKEDIQLVAESVSMMVKAVCFDMDQCLVAQHSRGRLRKDELEGFLARVTPDFIALVPELDKRGVKLAVTTHSDKAEYNLFVKPETHGKMPHPCILHAPSQMRNTDASGCRDANADCPTFVSEDLTNFLLVLGEDLVQAVLAYAVPQHTDKFFVVAYNPQVRYNLALPLFPHMMAKQYHIREVCRHYRLSDPSDCLLFDDDLMNVTMTQGCLALKVDPSTGLSVKALKDKLAMFRRP